MKLDDSYFQVSVLSKTLRPNLLSYLAMHQCVAEEVINPKDWDLFEEEKLGHRVVNHCLKYGHHSVIEHPTITFLVQGYPHEVMVQLTRHRHLSFSVQSQRYTGERIMKLNKFLVSSGVPDLEKAKEIEKLFYVRPVGDYKDRKGNYHKLTQEERIETLLSFINPIDTYFNKVRVGVSFEMARGSLPQCIRQDFIVTMNARSLLHFLDLRTPKDAQEEIRHLAFKVYEHFEKWMPEVANWYSNSRLGKNKLAP